MTKRLHNRLQCGLRSPIAPWLGVFVAAAVFVMLPETALAQEPAPEPQLRSSPHPIIGFGVMFLMLVIVISISLLPSKRGHQD